MTNEQTVELLNSIAPLRKGLKTEDWSESNEVFGCTDKLAANYCPTCTHDDGSCYYVAPPGGED